MSKETTTGTPWRAEVCNERGPIVVDQAGGLIGICNVWSFRDSRDEAKARYEGNVANTRRIVACVNACDGVPTDLLEAVRMPEANGMMRPAPKTLAEVQELLPTGLLVRNAGPLEIELHSQYKQQRDQLLAALVEVKRDVDHLRKGHFVNLDTVHDELTATIAAAKSVQTELMPR